MIEVRIDAHSGFLACLRRGRRFAFCSSTCYNTSHVTGCSIMKRPRAWEAWHTTS
jgi:hypothetical protein